MRHNTSVYPFVSSERPKSSTRIIPTYARTPALVGLMVVMALIGTMMAGCGSGASEGRSSSWMGLPTETLQGVGASVTVVPASNVLTAGTSMPVVVYVKDRYGRAAADDIVLTAGTKLGSSIDVSGNLETKKGVVQCTVTAGQTTGVETLTFISPEAIGTATFQIIYQQQPAPLVRVSPVTDSVKVSATLPIAVFITNTSGIPLDSEVTMFCLAGGSFEKSSGNASGGVFLTEFTAPAVQGVCWISAIVEGKTASTSIAVLP